MDRRILTLGRALRDAGAPVSTPEIIDAARAALVVGVDRRGDLRAALRAALVKHAQFAGEFDHHFERLFPAGIPRPRPRRRGSAGGVDDGAQEAAGRAAGSGVGNGQASSESAGAPCDDGGNPGEAGENPGDGRPDRPDGERGPADDRREVGGIERERRFPSAGERDETAWRAARERRRLLGKGFRERWDAAEEREAARAVEEAVRRLVNRLGRRRRRARRGAVDLAGTLRANLVHGGVPFVLRRKAQAPSRRDLVVIADVSGSVRRAAALFLLILAGLRNRFTGVRTFAYVDRPVEIPPALAARAPAEIGATLAKALSLDALSDHGETFRRFNRDFAGAAGGRSVVVILGDGRSNRFAAQEWELDAIRRRCRRLVWIVPEPETLWGSGDSAIPAYSPLCDQIIAAPNPAALVAAAARLSWAVDGL